MTDTWRPGLTDFYYRNGAWNLVVVEHRLGRLVRFRTSTRGCIQQRGDERARPRSPGSLATTELHNGNEWNDFDFLDVSLWEIDSDGDYPLAIDVERVLCEVADRLRNRFDKIITLL